MRAPDVRTPGSNPANAETQTTNQPTDSATSEPVQQRSNYSKKREANLKATAALLGVELHCLANGGWLASRWNLTRELADTEVEAWLHKIGGSV